MAYLQTTCKPHCKGEHKILKLERNSFYLITLILFFHLAALRKCSGHCERTLSSDAIGTNSCKVSQWIFLLQEAMPSPLKQLFTENVDSYALRCLGRLPRAAVTPERARVRLSQKYHSKFKPDTFTEVRFRFFRLRKRNIITVTFS